MDSMLAPLVDLDNLESKDLTPENLDTKIPIPSISHLNSTGITNTKKSTELIKYQDEYDKFCNWAALPKDLRKPPTAVAFEKKYMLPKGYTNYFKARDDFPTKRWTAFWDWMADLYPDVVMAVYNRAVSKTKGSDKAAGIFIDLLSKKMNLDAPRVSVQPMVLMGVPQDKIDALFVPKDYKDAVNVPLKPEEVKKE